VATVHSHVVAFDNVSGIQPWMSDALCRLATGGGLSKRTLYSDAEETIITAIRPIILNGIDDLANRADFAERALVLELDPVKQRRAKSDILRDLEEVAPRVLGALLDGLCAAIRLSPTTKLSELPRMADFAVWVAAAEKGLGFPEGSVLESYEKNRGRAVEVSLASSPVATAVRDMLGKSPVWSGTLSQLLDKLNLQNTENYHDKSWPRNARALSSSLKRCATFLRAIGVVYTPPARGSHKQKSVCELALMDAS
jgi:hypothetical protein